MKVKGKENPTDTDITERHLRSSGKLASEDMCNHWMIKRKITPKPQHEMVTRIDNVLNISPTSGLQEYKMTSEHSKKSKQNQNTRLMGP